MRLLYKRAVTLRRANYEWYPIENKTHCKHISVWEEVILFFYAVMWVKMRQEKKRRVMKSSYERCSTINCCLAEMFAQKFKVWFKYIATSCSNHWYAYNHKLQELRSTLNSKVLFDLKLEVRQNRWGKPNQMTCEGTEMNGAMSVAQGSRWENEIIGQKKTQKHHA